MCAYRLTGPLEEQDFLRYYEKITSDPDFYAEKFAGELFSDSAYTELTTHLVQTFNPETVLDMGCGMGKMVAAFRSHGIDTKGIDWSDYLIQTAPPELRPYLECHDMLDPDLEYCADLVICMETLEHFPPQYVNRAIERLKTFCGKHIFATIPSFGPNIYGPAGIQVINNEWMDDARNDKYFRHIVVDGHDIPHHGHLTLATYRWWTKKFLVHGLSRNPRLENLMYTAAGDLIKEHHWNMYILQPVISHEINFDSGDDTQLGAGWFDKEIFIRNGRETGVRWTQQKAFCYLNVPAPSHTLVLEFYSGPVQLLYDFTVFISVYHHGQGIHVMERQPFTFSPDTWYSKKIDTGAIVPGIVEIALEREDAWISKHYTKYDDPRKLGIAVHTIRITA